MKDLTSALVILNVPECGSYERLCTSGDTCVLAEWFCDGVDDCAEAEDELNCGKLTWITTMLLMQISITTM